MQQAFSQKLNNENFLAVLLASLGALGAYGLAPFANDKPAVAVAAVIFPIAFVALLLLPVFNCLQFGPKLLLILITLRPLVDFSLTFENPSAGFTLASSSPFSLQESFAAAFVLLLLGVWLIGEYGTQYLKMPNVLLLVLLVLTAISWVSGGWSNGTSGFARTAWGLVVALLFGAVFSKEQEIDLFMRASFYSCVFVLIGVLLNSDRGLRSGAEFRLGGQYGIPNTLAGVALSFFLYGLFVFARSRGLAARCFIFFLLLSLAAVIVLTQSRTVALLMIASVLFFMWSSGRRRLLFGAVIPAVVLVLLSSAAAGWRLVSSFSEGQTRDTLSTLTGRIPLWLDWLGKYQHAGLFHQVFGLGWAPMLREFLAMKLFGSSVTENSFLWFLIGTGALGLLAFSSYIIWVLAKSLRAWRSESTAFERQLALFAFLCTVCFIVQGSTTDLASAPNADFYLFAAMSIFAFQWRKEPSSRHLYEDQHVLKAAV